MAQRHETLRTLGAAPTPAVQVLIGAHVGQALTRCRSNLAISAKLERVSPTWRRFRRASGDSGTISADVTRHPAKGLRPHSGAVPAFRPCRRPRPWGLAGGWVAPVESPQARLCRLPAPGHIGGRQGGAVYTSANGWRVPHRRRRSGGAGERRVCWRVDQRGGCLPEKRRGSGKSSAQRCIEGHERAGLQRASKAHCPKRAATVCPLVVSQGEAEEVHGARLAGRRGGRQATGHAQAPASLRQLAKAGWDGRGCV